MSYENKNLEKINIPTIEEIEKATKELESALKEGIMLKKLQLETETQLKQNHIRIRNARETIRELKIEI